MIDVIIPVYNVEKYIDRCMESVLNQTYKDLKVILVDDGSTDKSGAICDEYARRYENVTVYHKANGGLSSARNYGIQKSTAEYIAFIDSDDYVNIHWFEELYTVAQRYDADMVCAGVTMVYDTTNVGMREEMPKDVGAEKVDKSEMYRRMFAQIGVDVSMYTKLFKLKVFDDIRFPDGELYEDMQIIEKLTESCNTLVVSDYKGYFYYQRQGSIMYSGMNNKRMKLISCMENLKNTMEIKYPKAAEAAKTRYVRCVLHVFNRAIYDVGFEAQARELLAIIRREKIFVRKCRYFELHEKVAVEMIAINVSMYKGFLKLYRRIR